MKTIATVLALTLATSAHALTRGTPIEYDGIKWSLNFDSTASPFYTGCTTLTASVVSTFAPGAIATVNYNLVCSTQPSNVRPTGSTGGYVAAPGVFEFSAPIGSSWSCQIQLSSLSGTCQVNIPVGSGQVTLTYAP